MMENYRAAMSGERKVELHVMYKIVLVSHKQPLHLSKMNGHVQIIKLNLTKQSIPQNNGKHDDNNFK